MAENKKIQENRNLIDDKEEQLKKFVRDLDHLIDQIRRLDNEPMKTSTDEQSNSSTIKQQAFELLIKAENLNDHIERDLQRDMPSLIDIDEIVKQVQQFGADKKLHSNSNATLRAEFELSSVEKMTLAKRAQPIRRLRIDEFVGLEALKSYLDSLWSSLSTDSRYAYSPTTTTTTATAHNALVFGPEGSGKMSFLINWLIERGVVSVDGGNKLNENRNDETTDHVGILKRRFKAFLIDMDSVLARPDLDPELLTRILDSISEYAQQITLGLVLVVIERLERLFDHTRPQVSSHVRSRFLADLLFYFELTSPSSEFNPKPPFI